MSNQHVLNLEYRENGKLIGTCSCGKWKSSVGSDEEAIFRAFEFHTKTAH